VEDGRIPRFTRYHPASRIARLFPCRHGRRESSAGNRMENSFWLDPRCRRGGVFYHVNCRMSYPLMHANVYLIFFQVAWLTLFSSFFFLPNSRLTYTNTTHSLSFPVGTSTRHSFYVPLVPASLRSALLGWQSLHSYCRRKMAMCRCATQLSLRAPRTAFISRDGLFPMHEPKA
jgi:hypothetical protein